MISFIEVVIFVGILNIIKGFGILLFIFNILVGIWLILYYIR